MQEFKFNNLRIVQYGIETTMPDKIFEKNASFHVK